MGLLLLLLLLSDFVFLPATVKPDVCFISFLNVIAVVMGTVSFESRV